MSFFFLILTWKDVSATKLTYEWYANLTAGSLLPKEHLSSYQIKAQVAVYVTNKTHYGFQVGVFEDYHSFLIRSQGKRHAFDFSDRKYQRD